MTSAATAASSAPKISIFAGQDPTFAIPKSLDGILELAPFYRRLYTICNDKSFSSMKRTATYLAEIFGCHMPYHEFAYPEQVSASQLIRYAQKAWSTFNGLREEPIQAGDKENEWKILSAMLDAVIDEPTAKSQTLKLWSQVLNIDTALRPILINAKKSVGLATQLEKEIESVKIRTNITEEEKMKLLQSLNQQLSDAEAEMRTLRNLDGVCQILRELPHLASLLLHTPEVVLKEENDIRELLTDYYNRKNLDTAQQLKVLDFRIKEYKELIAEDVKKITDASARIATLQKQIDEQNAKAVLSTDEAEAATEITNEYGQTLSTQLEEQVQSIACFEKYMINKKKSLAEFTAQHTKISTLGPTVNDGPSGVKEAAASIEDDIATIKYFATQLIALKKQSASTAAVPTSNPTK